MTKLFFISLADKQTQQHKHFLTKAVLLYHSKECPSGFKCLDPSQDPIKCPAGSVRL